jgi:hypothetical protein
MHVKHVRVIAHTLIGTKSTNSEPPHDQVLSQILIGNGNTRFAGHSYLRRFRAWLWARNCWVAAGIIQKLELYGQRYWYFSIINQRDTGF